MIRFRKGALSKVAPVAAVSNVIPMNVVVNKDERCYIKGYICSTFEDES
ncbi:MAG: hypothetical protein WA667_09010 [Candidatus Nitrosopolaris sp.]